MQRKTLEHESQGLSVQVARRNYASCLARLEKYSEAEPLLHKALHELVQLVGIYHPDALDTASNLARVLQEQGDFSRAQNLHRWVLDASLFGVKLSRSASLYAIAYARFLREWDEKAEALQIAQEAADSLVMLLGSDAHDTLLAKLDVAVLQCELGDYRNGLSTLSRVAITLVNLLGAAHPQAQMAEAALVKWSGHGIPDALEPNGGSFNEQG
jgi:tetratricopeptide (TPR) repeat protein